jgi:hypothetical protein
MKRIIALCFLICILLVSGCALQHGSSRDVVQGWDKGILWYHMYLKNDHTTAYCFDNPEFIKIFDDAQKTQREVIVTYETYLVRGILCSVSDKYEKVIITDVKYAD